MKRKRGRPRKRRLGFKRLKKRDLRNSSFKERGSRLLLKLLESLLRKKLPSARLKCLLKKRPRGKEKLKSSQSKGNLRSKHTIRLKKSRKLEML